MDENTAAELFEFKFKWIDEDGDEQGFFSKRGAIEGETLRLDETEIPISGIADTVSRENRVVLSVAMADETFTHLFLAVKGNKAKGLERRLGRLRSAIWAKNHREELASQGRVDEFLSVGCPSCSATLDLTGFELTPQVYCRFCDAIYTRHDELSGKSLSETKELTKKEGRLKLCDECGMYSTPQRFTIFYFYFLLVVYGWQYRQTWRCPACMRKDAWLMMLGNLPFLLGIPVAITQLIRSYRGVELHGALAKLDGANIKARSGKLQAAVSDYQKILEKQPVAAGVKFNIASALLHDSQIPKAAQMLEYSLKDCCNYEPAAGMLLQCYEQNGDEAKLADLKKQWGVEQQAPSEPGEEIATE
ncbi:hypothetical protein MalM25_10020 [Planctomycetes bacterium MalM25]|nr:hypothetical protein MalM25_10020 [Planctomycetes bacterium MalM25]